MTVRPYRHKVQYYETDQMGIVHHANYIHWMEEARVDLLEQLGWPFDKMEAMGIRSPVMYVDCRYKTGAVFPEEITVETRVEKFHGVRLVLGYEMRRADGTVVCQGRSEHCFTDRSGRILRMQSAYPEIYEALSSLAGA